MGTIQKKNISKVAADKLAFSGAVGAALEVSGKDVAEKAQAVLFPGRAPRIDFVEMLSALRAMVADAEDDYQRAEATHADELADDGPLREERDAAARDLVEGIVSARSTVTGVFGSSFCRRVGLSVTLQTRPDLLAKQAAAAVRQLGTAETPEAGFADATVDLGKIAGELSAKAERLSGLLTALERESREAESTMIARDQSAERWRGVVGLAGAMMEMLAEIAGEPEIAARVRPTARRRAGILDPGVVGDVDAGDVEGDVTDPEAPEPELPESDVA